MENNLTENNKDKSENTENNCNTDIKDECNPKKEDDYKIYNFIKEHPGVFLTVISMIVTGFSFFMNVVSYFLKKIELLRLNINLNELDLSITKNFYYYTISSILVFGLCTCLIFLISKIERYKYPVAIQKKYLLDIIKQEKKKLRKTMRGLKRKSNEYLYLRCIQCKNEIKNIENDYIKPKRKELLIADFKIALITIINTFLILIVQMDIQQEVTTEYLIIIFISFFTVSFLITVIILHSQSIKREHIKEKENILENTSFYELRKNKNIINKDFLSDKKITKNILLIILCVTIYSVVISFTFNKNLNLPQRDYWIYSDTNGTYAVVYNESNKYVLKEAEIDGDKLYINLSNQRIIESKDMIMEQISFDEVIKVDSKKQE